MPRNECIKPSLHIIVSKVDSSPCMDLEARERTAHYKALWEKKTRIFSLIISRTCHHSELGDSLGEGEQELELERYKQMMESYP
jgi:hypothetical protein